MSRLDYGFIYAHYVWILPLQSALIAYLIWNHIGWAALVGVIGLLLKTIPVQTGLSRLSSIVRMKVARRTDQRVGIMHEIIQGIQVSNSCYCFITINKLSGFFRLSKCTHGRNHFGL